MTVELIPTDPTCHQMGVDNGTFFTMVNQSGMDRVIGRQNRNDPISVTSAQARDCKRLLAVWTPPDCWGGGLRAPTMKDLLLEFLGRCDGFTTR